MKPIIVISGPTASGKSDIAIDIAKRINGYIINADSRQIYKEVPISTAQPLPEKRNKDGGILVDGVLHYLYGFIDLNNHYNIYKYNKDVKRVIELNPDMTPILVGGTGLYIDSYIYNYQLTENPTSSFSREYLNSLSIQELKAILGDKLQMLNESDQNNPVRIIRKIESSSKAPTKGERRNFVYLYLDIEIEELEKRIKERIEKMLDNGLEKEAQSILKQTSDKENILPKIIGITEFSPYFKNENTLEEVKKDIYTHTRQYAKRQITWFKRNKDIIRIKGLKDALRKVKGLNNPI
ncbi:tRNA (adenosine(37)-N6)-dimethylallyltransferase MiaA [Candidatus Dojkabacteria bacterium]|nr:tRNA (adenosine(37)-N6)-dimethylallyltransferase MiaA [Candidatus Dojkabacteria bacterium]